MAPWLRKLPSGFHDGQPYYTAEWVPGLEAGFQLVDVGVVVPALVAVVVVVLGSYRGWRPDSVLMLMSAMLVWVAGRSLLRNHGIERYAAEPGVYLALLAGLLLALVGASGLILGAVRRRNEGTAT